MPNHIHTIPVLDALRDPQGCALCVMHNKLETDAINFIMGPAYMEDDVRTQTNRLGFCESHLAAMYAGQNRLGLALMLHTYMRQLNKDISSIIKSKLPSPFFGKDANGPLAKIHAHLVKAGESCYVCNKIEDTYNRYIDTFLYLWNKGGDDAKLIKSQKSYCLPHFTLLVTQADKLSRSKREKFIEEIVLPQLKSMQELEEDLEWFTLKFDYRYADEPWKNSKDALPRALRMLGSAE
ncbi:MAG: DUF6062 family protein [Defluviitaleaceae bacterium]|nr:DUF6062 family protein [Defluviitaleaceae bacterium]